MRNDERAALMAERYAAGLSLAAVAAEFGIKRQSVHRILTRRNVPMRQATLQPSVEWGGRIYSLRSHGYFAATTGKRSYLHRDMWEAQYGPIPPGHDVHHKDEDKANNTLDNLDLHTQAEHGRRHGFGGNQNTGSLGRRPVKW